jgi:predicted XRE-type DNA-binding protein
MPAAEIEAKGDAVMAKQAGIGIERGSGNVFVDIGLADAGEHLVKAQLVTRIGRIGKQRKLTQEALGAIIGLRQPDVSKLLRGGFRGYSIERLLDFLIALGHDVEIVVKPARRRKRPARLTVKAA